MIVRVRPTITTDRYGNRVLDYGADAERCTIAGAFAAPTSSASIRGDGRDGVTVGLTLFAPYGTELHHDDRIEVDGVLYRIEGAPAEWSSPTGWRPGVQVALVRVEG